MLKKVINNKIIKYININEAIEEIILEFRVGPNQFDLFIKVYKFMTGLRAWVGNGKCTTLGITIKGLWIKNKKAKFYKTYDFIYLLEQLLKRDQLNVQKIIKIYMMVMGVKVYINSKSDDMEHIICVETEMENFKCKQCGNCCFLPDAYCITANIDDLNRWENEERFDILQYIDSGDFWFSPITGIELNRCPWLRKLPKKDKYKCRIQSTKPIHCHEYPKSKKHALKTGCKGFSDFSVKMKNK